MAAHPHRGSRLLHYSWRSLDLVLVLFDVTWKQVSVQRLTLLASLIGAVSWLAAGQHGGGVCGYASKLFQVMALIFQRWLTDETGVRGRPPPAPTALLFLPFLLWLEDPFPCFFNS